jgi:hypothetical protein
VADVGLWCCGSRDAQRFDSYAASPTPEDDGHKGVRRKSKDGKMEIRMKGSVRDWLTD